jgi:two-component system OmpR family response regulator
MAQGAGPGAASEAESRMKVLVIEDDRDTADYVARGLKEHGHVVDHAASGRDGLFLAADGSYDVMVVDRMLPELDGLALVKTLRGAKVCTPVLFLTALGGIDDRVEGLEAGGDDYLVKPFVFAELLARVHALARRPPVAEVESVLRVADLEIDLIARRVARAGRRIDLQPREFRLLEYLVRHAGEVVTRTMLLEQVWEFHFDPRTNIVETHVSRLRAKVDRDFEVGLIHTVRGAGYCIRAPA